MDQRGASAGLLNSHCTCTVVQPAESVKETQLPGLEKPEKRSVGKKVRDCRARAMLTSERQQLLCGPGRGDGTAASRWPSMGGPFLH